MGINTGPVMSGASDSAVNQDLAGEFISDNLSLTIVTTEQTPNDRNIRFTTNGTERALINSSGNFGIGTSSPNAILDISSTSDGILIPRMSTGQRDALSVTESLLIYNTTENNFQFYEGPDWVNFIIERDVTKIKVKTSAERDALIAVEGDAVYNSDADQLEIYTGSEWQRQDGWDYEVNNFTDLTTNYPAATHNGKTAKVLNDEGTYLLGTKKKSGFYQSDGLNWNFLGAKQDFILDSAKSAEKTYSSNKIEALTKSGTESIEVTDNLTINLANYADYNKKNIYFNATAVKTITLASDLPAAFSFKVYVMDANLTLIGDGNNKILLSGKFETGLSQLIRKGDNADVEVLNSGVTHKDIAINYNSNNDFNKIFIASADHTNGSVISNFTDVGLWLTDDLVNVIRVLDFGANKLRIVLNAADGAEEYREII